MINYFKLEKLINMILKTIFLHNFFKKVGSMRTRNNHFLFFSGSIELTKIQRTTPYVSKYNHF